MSGSGGGFLGVDVFFVISGYLITSLIMADADGPGFSYRTFLERRARRLLPALFAMVAASLAAAWFLYTPLEYRGLLETVLSILLFVSNFYFWQESGYFGDFVDLNPLLHTWSLAVEEEFYLIFPAVLLIAWRFGMRLVWIMVLAGFCLSLAAAEVMTARYPLASFFFSMTRAWELLLGVVCALILRSGPAPGAQFAAPLSVLGLPRVRDAAAEVP